MPRQRFGGRLGDMVVSTFTSGLRKFYVPPSDIFGAPVAVALEVWDVPGGMRLVDLLAPDETTPIGEVVAVDGQVPEFFAPDGYSRVYLRDPDGDFYALEAHVDGLAAQVAADRDAVAADRAAVEAIGTTTDTVIAGRVAEPTSATSVELGTAAGDSGHPLGAQMLSSYVPRASDALTSVKVGTSALGAATTGAFNVAVGDSALAANTTGQLNTAVGAFAATSGTTATQNTAVGTNALRLNTTGVDNVAVGFNCLRSQTDAAGNTGVGSAAGYSLTTGHSNVAVGANSLYAATVALENVAVGVNALRNTTGNNNVGIGVAALYSNTTGIENTAIGTSALNWATTAVHNTAAGVQAGFSATTGSQNVILGVNALYTLTTGGQNVAVGFGAGYTLTPANGVVASSGHTHIGQQSGLGVATDPSFTTTLGYRTLADAAGGVAIGVDSTGASAHSVAANEVALGTAAHTTRLAGYLQIDRGQATVGAAGAASALPATPTKYLSVKDSTGTEYVFPVYAKV